MPTRGINFLRDLGRLHENDCPHWNVEDTTTGTGEVTHQCRICHKFWMDDEYQGYLEKRQAEKAEWEAAHPMYRITQGS